MKDKQKILAEIERLKHYGTIPYDRDVFEGVCLIESFINSLPAEQPNFKVEFAGKEYEVVRVRELSNGTTMYGILDEPNHIDYINKDSCEIVSEQPSGDLEKFIQDLTNKYPINKDSVPEQSLNDYYQGLRFGVLQGVNWKKEQMMKGFCYETKVYRDEEGDGIDTPIESWLALENNEITNLPNIGLSDGDKVKVIIVKEDKQ